MKGASVGGIAARRLGDRARDLAQALLSLAGAGAEAGVAFDLLEVGPPQLHGVLDVGQGDVLAAAEDHLARHGAARSPYGAPGAGGSNMLSSIGSSKTTSLMVVTTVIGPACVSETYGILTSAHRTPVLTVA